jgi:hypothetical protein
MRLSVEPKTFPTQPPIPGVPARDEYAHRAVGNELPIVGGRCNSAQHPGICHNDECSG